MADIVEQLPFEALGKILACLGVRYFRSFKRRLTLAKRYSEEFSAFFRLMLQDENTEPKYRNFVVRYHVQWIATADHHPNCARGTTCNCATLCAMDSRDMLGLVIIDCYRVIGQYRAVLGAICACCAWCRGLDRYLGHFDSSLEELRRLVSWDCQVPCMNRVLGVSDDDDDEEGVSLENAHLICIDPLHCVPGTGDLLKKLRHAYKDLGHEMRLSFEPDFPYERPPFDRRQMLRARLWRGCRRYGRRH